MEALGINLGLLIVQLIAFAIVFLTLNAWVYKPMLDMMESRKTKIAQGLEDARVAAEARANAEKEAAKVLAEAQAEAGKVVREATERAASAGKDVKAAAEAEAAKAREAAMAEAELERIAFSAICADRLPPSPLPPPTNLLVMPWMRRNSTL